MTNKKTVAFLRKRFQLKMNSARKADGRDMLIRYMAAHPAPVQPATTWVSGLFEYFNDNRLMMAGAFAGVVMIISTAGMVEAQGALPGSSLYGVKVHVNEALRNDISLSPALAAQWQIERLNRRIGEAENLQQSGAWNATTQAEVESLASEHVAEISRLAGYYVHTDQEAKALAIKQALTEVIGRSASIHVDIAGNRVALSPVKPTMVPDKTTAQAPDTHTPVSSLKGATPVVQDIPTYAGDVKKERPGADAEDRKKTSAAQDVKKDAQKKLEDIKSLLPSL